MTPSNRRALGYDEPRFLGYVQCANDRWHIFICEHIPSRNTGGMWSAMALPLSSGMAAGDPFQPLSENEYSGGWSCFGDCATTATKNLLDAFATSVGDGIAHWRDGQQESFKKRAW